MAATAGPGVRARRREDVTARVLQVGREHLATYGAAALSLRAVTRDLGMVSSAVYRYVESRDELITLLVIDAYDELGDAVDAARASAAGRPWSHRLLVTAQAFRDWAIAEPARYALLFGSPVPGYDAPAERTIEPGTRVIRTWLALVAEGVACGEVAAAGVVPLPRALRADLVQVRAGLGPGMEAVEPAVLARAVGLWAVIVGAVSLEVFGQYGESTFAEPGLLFEHQVRSGVAALRG